MPYDNGDKYANQDILCYAFFLSNGSMRVYPRYVLNTNGGMDAIKDGADAFPPYGAIFFPETEWERQWGESSAILQLRYQKGTLANNIIENKDALVARRTNGVRVFPYRYGCGFPCLHVRMSSAELQKELKFSYHDQKGNLLRVPDASMYVKCSDGKILGPFAYRYENDEIVLTGKKNEDYFVNIYNDNKLTLLPLYSDTPNGGLGPAIMYFISKANVANASTVGRIDCISELSLKDYLVDLLKAQQKYGANMAQIKSALSELVVTKNLMTDSRRDKVISLIPKTEIYTDLKEHITKLLLSNTDTAKQFVYATINASPKIFIDLIKERQDIANKLSLRSSESTKPISAKAAAPSAAELQLTETRQQIKALKQQCEKMEAAMNKAKADANEAKGAAKDIANLQQDKARLEREIQSLEGEKANLDNELKSLRKQQDLDEESLRRKYMKLEAAFETSVTNHIEELKKKIEQYKSSTKGFADIVDKKLLHKVLEAVSRVEGETSRGLTPAPAPEAAPVKQTIDPIQASKETPTPLPVEKINYELSRIDTGKAIITRVTNFLQKSNRYIDEDEVANYLICLTQGFITTFAGKPGCGKTSLCNLLAQALGLVNGNCQPHFIDIPVARGWTSLRDFIGYYNPLSQSMVKTNAPLYDALDAAQAEDSEISPPLMVLLDEANLSSIEHYWSAFLKNSDFSSSVNRSFSLGGDENWAIGNHLRFMATVNHDHTTEDLSPRFLDRSWVIVLQPSTGDDEDFAEVQPPEAEPAVPLGALVKAFGAIRAEENFEERNEQYEAQLGEIKQIFRKNRIPIMPRSTKMVADYIKVASLYMSEEYKPYDYAIAQKLLPSLNGNGPEFRGFLEQLRERCSAGASPLCHSLLSDIIQTGDDGNMNIYDFFAH